MIEKKTQAALHATQDKNRISNELSDLRDQGDIKDRKINVLQRKVCITAQSTLHNLINWIEMYIFLDGEDDSTFQDVIVDVDSPVG